MDLQELLDFTQLEKLLMYFSVLTGLDAALYNANGDLLIARRNQEQSAKQQETAVSAGNIQC